MAKLPVETADDLRAQATISPADIVKARQNVAKLQGPVKYLDGKALKVTRGERVRLMWEADTK